MAGKLKVYIITFVLVSLVSVLMAWYVLRLLHVVSQSISEQFFDDVVAEVDDKAAEFGGWSGHGDNWLTEDWAVNNLVLFSGLLSSKDGVYVSLYHKGSLCLDDSLADNRFSALTLGDGLSYLGENVKGFIPDEVVCVGVDDSGFPVYKNLRIYYRNFPFNGNSSFMTLFVGIERWMGVGLPYNVILVVLSGFGILCVMVSIVLVFVVRFVVSRLGGD